MKIFRLSIALSLGALGLLAQSVLPSSGTPGTYIIRGATIHPVTSPVIPSGHLVIADGKIERLGAGEAPAGVTGVVIDATGFHVYPGMIDANTNIGLIEINSVRGSVDSSEIGDFNPNARASAALNPHSELIPVTRVSGVTTVISVPEGGIISGQGAMINLSGWTPQQMVLRDAIALYVDFPRLRSGGFNAAELAEEEKKAKKGYEKQLEDLRQRIRDAQAFARAVEARAPGSTLPRLERDLVLESMQGVVGGRVPVVIQADYARDIREAVKFAEEAGVRMILSGGAHVQEVIDLLREKQIPVLLGPILSLPPRADDPYDLIFTNAAALHAAGIPFAIQTRDAHNARNLPYHAAACAAFGLPKEEALKSITINPARIFGVDDVVGSLEPGKMANLFVADGDPLEITTNVREVFIAGERMPMDSRHTLLYEKFRARPRKSAE
ncbi:MAG TPA: amidohydrolase family protein [Thermoanaerobaculia bacterium]|nr:amidohydrolase family protein [Thermoanaerobaculia bacterium]